MANLAGLGLEGDSVALDAKGFIAVDAWQNTSAEKVYAVGDITDCPALTPVAIAAARRLMDRVFGGQPDARLDYHNIPSVVFSHPPIGTIGMTEAQARTEHGAAVKIYTSRFLPMIGALTGPPTCSLTKLVCCDCAARGVRLHLIDPTR